MTPDRTAHAEHAPTTRYGFYRRLSFVVRTVKRHPPWTPLREPTVPLGEPHRASPQGLSSAHPDSTVGKVPVLDSAFIWRVEGTSAVSRREGSSGGRGTRSQSRRDAPRYRGSAHPPVPSVSVSPAVPCRRNGGKGGALQVAALTLRACVAQDTSRFGGSAGEAIVLTRRRWGASGARRVSRLSPILVRSTVP